MRTYFGENLKNIRLARNLSQQDLANMVGIDRANISRWENGTVEIPLSIAYHIAKTLRVNLNDMVSKDLTKDANFKAYLELWR